MMQKCVAFIYIAFVKLCKAVYFACLKHLIDLRKSLVANS